MMKNHPLLFLKKKKILTMINNHKSIKLNKLYVPNKNNNKKVSRQRDIETKRQKDKETKRQRDKETKRQRDKETKRQRDKETKRQREKFSL